MSEPLLLRDAEATLRQLAASDPDPPLLHQFMRVWLTGTVLSPELRQLVDAPDPLRSYQSIACVAFAEAAGVPVAIERLDEGLRWLQAVALDRGSTPAPVTTDAVALLALALACRQRQWLQSWHDRAPEFGSAFVNRSDDAGLRRATEISKCGNPEAVALVLRAMEALDLPLPEPLPQAELEVRRFSSDGAVIVRGTTASVFIGGTLIGVFETDDDQRGPRNVLAVTLAKSEQFHLGRLATAFGMTDEHLRRLRRREETDGLGAMLGLRRGKTTKVNAELRAAWIAMFDAGRMPVDVYREQPRRHRLSHATIGRVYQEWRRRREEAAASEAPAAEPAAPIELTGQLALAIEALERGADLGEDAVTPDEFTKQDDAPRTAQPVRGGKMVQHVGTWILLALVGELGLHEEAQRAFEGRHPDGLRIALDAVICALAIGQRCVEGVRRLATPTGATLLRADRVPTASGVRKLLGRLIAQTDGGTVLEARMAERLIVTATSERGPAIFYVDNHLRPYTGEHVIRKGWRMQDKRVLPGTTDYYVHDEDGRPMFRAPAPSHDHLTEWLLPLGQRLREALGPDETILLAFDRGGAYAEQLAALRDAHFDFVTYERKPYSELATTAFRRTTICGDEVELHESRLRNLGKGRGRIRRIVVRTEDGRQVSLLASSKVPAERLVEILWNRWRQENGFKHGNERWGIIISTVAASNRTRPARSSRTRHVASSNAPSRSGAPPRATRGERSLGWPPRTYVASEPNASSPSRCSGSVISKRSDRCFPSTLPSRRRSSPASSCVTPGSSRRSSTPSASPAPTPKPSWLPSWRRTCAGRARPRS
jgi:hypothetical protein